MTAIITWNIQAGRGVDGAVDLKRIARALHQLGDADVLCLQEVARFVPELDHGAATDQVAALAELFPGFAVFFGAAIDRLDMHSGRRQAFGNLIMTRLPALQVFHHPLPQPADPTVKHMPRQAAEIVAATPAGPLRIITTHLEFNSPLQRDAQIEHLRTLHAEANANTRRPPLADGAGIYAALPRPASLILCGDFNCIALDNQHRRLTAPFDDALKTPRLCDAWPLAHPGQPHDPTCGLFDKNQWPQGPHCRDFFLVSEDLSSRVLTVTVDKETNASDHQPLCLWLAD